MEEQIQKEEEVQEETQKESLGQEPKSSTQKIDDKKIFSILSYISILCLIPLLTKKDDPFIFFHAKQGLVLFIAEIAWYIINRIIAGIFLGNIYTFGFLTIWGLIATIVNLGLLVLAIIGIANVIGNKKKELPLIGKFAGSIKI